MNKFFKVILIIGIVIVIFGGVLFGIAIGTHAFAEEERVTKEYVIDEFFNSFDFDLSITDVKFEKADANKVACNERKKHYHEVKVENEKLVIKFKDDYKWYENIFNFNFKSITVTVYLTEANYDNLDIKSSTGDVEVSNDFTFNTANIKVSTGDVKFNADCNGKLYVKSSTGSINLNGVNSNNDIEVYASTGNIDLIDVTSNNLKADVDTGHVKLDNTIINNHIEIKTSTGSVKFIDSDADTLNIKTSTGSVTGNLKTGKNFDVETSTGKKTYPTDSTGGLCKIKTSTGNVNIEIK